MIEEEIAGGSPDEGNGGDDDVDHCVDEIEMDEDEATPDSELPPADGGVENHDN